jgi:hypothetical protein
MREALHIRADQKAIFTRDDGAIFYVMMEPGGLWIHAKAPEGKSPGRVDFEHNAGNEGWLHCDLREPIKPQPLARTPRSLAKAEGN